MRATAVANANLALVKYWGKRDERLILPRHGSISLTLKGLETRTAVTFERGLAQDEIRLNGAPLASGGRVQGLLDIVRALAGTTWRARVETENNFPAAAGLASSASAFAALALAASSAAGLRLDGPGLSRLARQGSGSACRSVYGGFVEWLPGDLADGSDSFAVPIAPEEHWDLPVLIAIVHSGPKEVSSSEGMARSVATSPFYPAWRLAAERDLPVMRRAIRERDLGLLGRIAEENALRMHGTALAASPPVLYWAPGTLRVLEKVRALRRQGLEAYASMDAGPNVHVLASRGGLPALEAELAALPEVSEVRVSGPGPAARLLDAP